MPGTEQTFNFLNYHTGERTINGNRFSVQTVSFDDISTVHEWDRFIADHPEGTPYHQAAWLHSISKSYRHPCTMLTYKTENRIAGIFPYFRCKTLLGKTRIVSLPFSDYGGPLCIEPLTVNDLFIDGMRPYLEAKMPIEIRCRLPGCGGVIPWNHYVSHTIALKAGIEQIRAKLDKKTVLYSIRKAKNAGVLVVDATSPDGLDAFINLNLLTRRKHGVPPQPRSFFENLYADILGKDNGFILTAVFDEKVIGAGLFITFNGQIHYKFNASDPNQLNRVSPNHLILLTALEKAVEKGCQIFDFGRTAIDNSGLLRYKRLWGAEEQPLIYYFFPVVKGTSSIRESSTAFRLFSSLWRHLPLKVTEIFGTYGYRYFH